MKGSRATTVGLWLPLRQSYPKVRYLARELLVTIGGSSILCHLPAPYMTPPQKTVPLRSIQNLITFKYVIDEKFFSLMAYGMD